jgi:hypothetical protein
MMLSPWPGRFVAASCALLAIWMVVFCSGCGASALAGQRAAVNAVALAANAAIPLVAEAEQREALAAITAADDLPDAQLRLMACHRKWDAIWLALDAVATAQNAAATDLETGRPLDLGTLRAAWCALQTVLGGTDVDVTAGVEWGCQ